MAIALPPWPGRLTAHARPGSIALTDEAGCNVRIDSEGRWRSIGLAGPILQRCLDGRVVLRRRQGSRRSVEPLDEAEAGALHDDIRASVRELLEGLAEGRTELVGARESESFETIESVLEAAATWGAERFAEDRLAFEEAYDPVGILPPDHYRDVVVQPSIGCPYNRCSYCTFYRDQRYRVRGPGEFREHLRAVKRFFGRALAVRWGVFLGEANALSMSDDRLHEVLALVAEELGGSDGPSRPAEIGSFFDPHHAPRRGPEEFAALRRAGLRSVAIGMESGSQEMLDLLGKDGLVSRTTGAVRAAIEGGLRIALMVLVGPGDERQAEVHRRATVHALDAMDLSREDLVFLSPLSTGEYGFDVLPADRIAEETRRFRCEIAAVTDARISPYRIEEFQYYA